MAKVNENLQKQKSYIVSKQWNLQGKQVHLQKQKSYIVSKPNPVPLLLAKSAKAEILYSF